MSQASTLAPGSVSGSSARQLKPLSTQAATASRPTKDQCDDLQVNNQIVESNQDMAFESRIKVRTRVQLVDVNITTDCVCRDPCK
jgi:hypothetical protein